MQSLMSYSEIYHYLVSNGHKITSQSVLRDPEANPALFWNILVSLSRKIEIGAVPNTFAVLAHQLDDPEKHLRSLEWLCSKVGLTLLFAKLKLEFKIIHYLRPDKERMHTILSRMVSACIWCDQVKKSAESMMIVNARTQKDLQKMRGKLEQVSMDQAELQRKKKAEEPICRQRVKIQEGLRQVSGEEKGIKLELMRRQKDLEDGKSHAQKALEGLKFQICEMEFEVVRLKKEIAQNAPEIKKESKIQEELFASLQRQFARAEQIAKAKINHFRRSLSFAVANQSSLQNCTHLQHICNILSTREQSILDLTRIIARRRDQNANLLKMSVQRQEQVRNGAMNSKKITQRGSQASSKLMEMKEKLQRKVEQLGSMEPKLLKFRESIGKLLNLNKELNGKVETTVAEVTRRLGELEAELQYYKLKVETRLENTYSDFI